MRLLPALDFALAAGRPKVVAGYSDVTAILLAIYQRSGVVTFHGPVVKELPEKGVEDIAGILMDDRTSAPPMVLDLSGKGLVLAAGLARGKVLGGNLSILTHLVGTPYMPDLEGAVLFLEETGEPLYRVDRMITHLALSGVFKRLAGLLIGDFIGCGDPYAVQDLLMEHVGPLEIPVMAGFPVGHGRVNRLVPMGLEATVDTAAMRVIWHESCLLDPETAT
jgi:muramoyltetrapeptide carboxypeptidase